MKEITAQLLKSINQVEMALCKLDKDFTHEFPVLGTMKGKGASKEACERWSKDMPFLLWKRAKVSLSSMKDADVMIGQYEQAVAHEAEIVAALRANKYVKALAAIGEDLVAADSLAVVSIDATNYGMGPGITVFYQLQDGCVDLMIQDGSLTRIQINLGDGDRGE